MGVGEHHSLRGQAVEVGRGNLAVVRVKAMDVAIAQVVGEDEDDVGASGRPLAFRRLAFRRRFRQQQRRQHYS